jgi:RNA polymerase sigma-70 factor (ECF subfamily)
MRPNLTSPENFAALVREHQNMVFRTLTRLTGPGPHVEDLAQEAFLRLFRALPEFRGDATISTYLYRIVVNLAQDEWKRRRRERTTFSQPPAYDEEPEAESTWLENQPGDPLTAHARTPEQQLADADTVRIVDDELARLPEVERTVLVLYHQEDVSYEGISTALSMPINTVRTHLHRGRKRLAERIRARLGPAAKPLFPNAAPAPAGGHA